MTTALPHEAITDLADSLNTDAEAIFEALYSLANTEPEEVMEAIESLRTTDVSTLRQYLHVETVLENVDSLWMEAA